MGGLGIVNIWKTVIVENTPQIIEEINEQLREGISQYREATPVEGIALKMGIN